MPRPADLLPRAADLGGLAGRNGHRWVRLGLMLALLAAVLWLAW